MPTILVFIVLSLSFYLFYKMKYFRTKRPMERRFLSAKSSIALGLFVTLFGINQYIIHQSTTALIIGIVFLLVGCGGVWMGYRAYKYFRPLVIAESRELKHANA
jgi:hypothetical protein